MWRVVLLIVLVGLTAVALLGKLLHRPVDPLGEAPVSDDYTPAPSPTEPPRRVTRAAPAATATAPPASAPAASAPSDPFAALLAQAAGQAVDPAQAAAARAFIAQRPYFGQEATLTLPTGAPLHGRLFDADPVTVSLLDGETLHRVKWNDAQAASAVAVMRQVLAPMDATKHLNVAEYLLARGEPQLFLAELEAGLRLDPAVKPRVDQLMVSWQRQREQQVAGTGRVPVSPPTAGRPGMRVEPYPAPGTYDSQPFLDQVEREAAETARRSGIRFDRLATERFLVYHTWGARSHDTLRLSLERMYEAVVRCFGTPSSVNLFAGKCPVFVVTDFDQFRAMCRLGGFEPSRNTLGITITGADGSVRMVMFWNGEEQRFLQTLTHEGVHAVLHRYRSPADVDAWLNEGLAEYITAQLFPQSGMTETARVYAANFARGRQTLGPLFAARTSPPGDYYPICQSLVDYLIRTDARAFAALLAEIKDGRSTAEALLRTYRLTFEQLEASWRTWALQQAP